MQLFLARQCGCARYNIIFFSVEFLLFVATLKFTEGGEVNQVCQPKMDNSMKKKNIFKITQTTIIPAVNISDAKQMIVGGLWIYHCIIDQSTFQYVIKFGSEVEESKETYINSMKNSIKRSGNCVTGIHCYLQSNRILESIEVAYFGNRYEARV